MSNENLIDPEAIENLRALSPDDGDGFLRDIIGIYIEDTPKRIQEMKESLVAADQPKFTRAAHSIKGSSSNIGATEVRALAEKLEHDSRNNGLAGLETRIAQLEASFAATCVQLAKIVPQG